MSTTATATATATATMLQSTSPSPALNTDKPPSATSRPSLPRRSSSLHKVLITKLRPLPFQYLWSVWHSKSTAALLGHLQQYPQSFDAYQLSLLVESVADIGAFYRIFNNLPWSSIRHKDSVHIFRAGVQPLWEDEENKRGGRWLIRVKHADVERVTLEHGQEGVNKRRKDVRTWEEICLLCLGGELQSVIAQERDHILGVSFSPRSNFTHISIWTKQGDNQRSILLLERAILSGLSPDLRPKSNADFNYRKHTDKVGFVGGLNMQMTMQMKMQSRQQAQAHMMGSFFPPLPMSRPGPVRALTVG